MCCSPANLDNDKMLEYLDNDKILNNDYIDGSFGFVDRSGVPCQ
jgi:hypothetical protein